MAKSQAAVGTPQIHEAHLGTDGAVKKGAKITQVQAEALRRIGRDVVVCGPDLSVNRDLAKTIEKNANGQYKRCAPHRSAGLHALPHYQPDPRGQNTGHTFYETPNRKAF